MVMDTASRIAVGDVPLAVDLDGTLLHTDVLWENALALLARNPLILFLLPFWLLRGRAHLKRMLALRAPVDAFFDAVLVNSDVPSERDNRLKILIAVREAMGRVADFSLVTV